MRFSQIVFCHVCFVFGTCITADYCIGYLNNDAWNFLFYIVKDITEPKPKL